MAALTGNKIKDSYLGLLKTTDSGIFTSSLIRITDGGGNGSQLYLSNTAIRFHNAYTFPNADGTSGQVLSTDGSGTLYFTESSDNQTLEEVLTQGNTTTIAISSSADITTTAQFNGDINGALLQKVKAAEVLSKGDVVYISGGTGDNPEVSKANASDSTKMPALGIMKESLNNINDEGECITSGELTGLNLTGFSTGDELFVSSATAGGLVDTAPTGEANLIQKIGKVIKGGNGGALTVLGAFRVNALPNLPTGVILGNGTSVVSASSNLLIASDGTITLYQPNNVPSDIKNYNIGGGNIALNTDGFNTGFGEGNLSQVGFVGSNNSAFGYQSSFSITTGDNNTSVGFSSLLNETVGVDNTAIGNYSLFYSNNGNFNTAIGSYSLYANTLGGQNVALGYQALNFNTTSSHNTALGFRALRISTGDHNLGVGYNSGNAIATGNNNVVIGSNTGSTIDGLSNRIIISDGAANIRQLIDNVGKLQMPDYGSGTHTGTLAKTLAVDSSGYVIEVDATTGTVTSVALSVPTGLTVTGSPITTSGTITIGGTLGVANGGTGATTLTGILVGNGTSAISVVSDGIVSGQVLSTNANGTYSFIDAAGGDVTKTGGITANQIAVWNDSTDELRSDETVTIGTDHSITLYQPNTNSNTTNYIIGGGSSMTTGELNTGFGSSVLTLNTTGVGNVAIGSDSLTTNVSGNNNVAIGLETLKRTTASDNIAIGSRVLQFDTTGYKNTAIGGLSQYNITTAYGNTSLGYNSLIYNSTGIQNTAIGLNSLKGVSTYSASNNTAIGYNSGSAITTGSYNVIIGSNTGSTIATSSSNIIISDGSGTIRQSFDFTGAATFTASGGSVVLDSNGQIESKQSLDVATAGGRFTGKSNRGTLGQIRIEQSTTEADGGYMAFSTCAAGSTTPTDRLTISSGGNATFNETTTLNATGNSYTDGSLVLRNSDGTTNTYLTNAAGAFYLSNNGTSAALTISSTGAATFSGTSVVGVTVANTNYAIGEAYNSFGNLNIYTTNAEAQNMGGSLTLGGTGAGGVYSYAAIYGKKESAGVGSALGYLAFATDNNSNLVERMRITSGGNVGIGTDAPLFDGLSQLTVKSSTEGGIVIQSGATSYSRLFFAKDDTSNVEGLIRYYHSDNSMQFYTNATPAMHISSGGVVEAKKGFSATLGTAFVNVRDNGNGAILSTESTAKTIGMCSGTNYGSGSNNAFILLTGGASTSILVVSNQNGVQLARNSTAWTSASDETLKENIKPLENVLDKIKDFRCVKYNLKNSKEDKKIGFIAQDWEKDFDPIISKDDEGLLGMKYTETIPVLLKAIQEQQTIIEDLKSRIETLEG